MSDTAWTPLDEKSVPEELLSSASGISPNKALQNLLLKERAFSKSQLDVIEAHADKENLSFVKVLLFYGHMSRSDYEALIRKEIKVNKIDLLTQDIDYELLSNFDQTYLQDKLVFPVRIDSNSLILAMVNPLDKEVIDKIYERIKMPLKIYYATDVDIQWALHKGFGKELASSAVYSLFFEDERSSAIETFTLPQTLILAVLGSLLIIGLAINAKTTLIILMALINLLYLFSIAFKFILTLAGARFELYETVTKAEVEDLTDAELPIYSILLPVYKEPEVISTLIAGLNKLDYPKEKLDIKILLEEDDYSTMDCIRNLNIPSHFECIVVPNMQPKTKPKACNYGLVFCKGELVTIYDAEDIPEADQLKKAIIGFRKFPQDVICIQAQLNYFNANENFLTRMFTLEYSYWFDYMLPGMDRLNVPIPLGGTSNHFIKDKLIELNAWDPFNVTEDADLGIRAYAKGYKIGTINSTTYEEANKTVSGWIKQRSRWVKGYMQTFLVHMRNPFKLLSKIGIRGMFSFFLFIGGTPATFLINLPLWIIFIVWLVFKPAWITEVFPAWVLYISLFNLLIGNSMVVYMNMLAVFRRRLYNLVTFALLNPIYWILHSLASYKALWQLITDPFYWEKTSHGLTTYKHPEITGK
jgi:glycosyltransferase XagB